MHRVPALILAFMPKLGDPLDPLEGIYDSN